MSLADATKICHNASMFTFDESRPKKKSKNDKYSFPVELAASSSHSNWEVKYRLLSLLVMAALDAGDGESPYNCVGGIFSRSPEIWDDFVLEIKAPLDEMISLN